MIQLCGSVSTLIFCSVSFLRFCGAALMGFTKFEKLSFVY